MKEKLSIIYKILIVIVSGIGLYLNFKLVGIQHSVIYFTILSNLYCFLFYLITLLLKLKNKLKKADIYYFVKGSMVMSLTITMIMFQLFLANSNEIKSISNSLLETGIVHILVPTLVIYDYIFFGEKGKAKIKFAFEWSLILILYLVFWFIYTSLGGLFINGTIYPYFYMNIEELGIKSVIVNNVLIYISFILLGILIIFVDKLIARDNEKIER
ncbi:MAG: Pr6Pr family membrane protein [Bacilli bacterium]|nr:Pr6Pr family membrane protein [Bacilli bacterium]